jgi:preprotein translocase subunit SecD
LVTVGINPTLNLPAVAGIIAAVGTGVDDQIVMADEGRETHLRDLWDRIKRAFFIIFTAAASTIGAMIPLYFVGAGALQGFAITTIIGVLIGIFITRPAYAQILIHFHEDYER